MNRAALVIVGVCAIGCSEPLEFADWTIPVPEGARIIEYDYVSSENRGEVIELVEELVIGGDSDDLRYSFYRPRSIAVDDAGSIYVADAGDHQVKVYDRNGTHLYSLGREGQGPGEFIAPGDVVISGSTLVVVDEYRLSYWQLDGTYIDETTIRRNMPRWITGLDDGSMVVLYPALDEALRQTSVIARWDSEGTELVRFAELLDDWPTLWYPSRNAEGRVSALVAPPISSFSASPTGRLYLTNADEYQILALEAAGTPAWALRAAYRRPPVSRKEIDQVMQGIRARFPGAKEGELDWPEVEPALSRIWVDGHGHLYVFPYAPVGLEPQRRPVDVYSADGERLFAGHMPSLERLPVRRFHLHGDHLYDIRPDPETGESSVVRYRLVEPFE